MSKLVPIVILGIYKTANGQLPAHMAQLAPDAAASLAEVNDEIKRRGGTLRLSDAYRDSAMQAKAHDDYVHGRKTAYSPPAGSSMHEAGRAIDVDLATLIHPGSVPAGHTLFNENEIRSIFGAHGWTFIAPVGNPHSVDVAESWHFEKRGKFAEVYDKTLKDTLDHKAAYRAMTRAAIADLSHN